MQDARRTRRHRWHGAVCLTRWCVWLVGGDGASGLTLEVGVLGGAGGVDVVVVEVFVVVGAEQDEVREYGRAAVFDGDDVVGLEFAGGGA
jgi:hypothetical protein